VIRPFATLTLCLGALAMPLLPTPGRTAPTEEVVSPSRPDQVRLAEDLQRKGAIVYGAWWCSHCFHQKNLFGTEGARRLPYVECDKTDEGRERCRKAGIRAFPTWVLGEKRSEGVMTLDELRTWAGLR
jgi:glutaredoxin